MDDERDRPRSDRREGAYKMGRFFGRICSAKMKVEQSKINQKIPIAFLNAN